jgi:hypothetical protein
MVELKGSNLVLTGVPKPLFCLFANVGMLFGHSFMLIFLTYLRV